MLFGIKKILCSVVVPYSFVLSYQLLQVNNDMQQLKHIKLF